MTRSSESIQADKKASAEEEKQVPKESKTDVIQPNGRHNDKNRTVLVVGANSEIGASTIKHLRKGAYNVYGTTRNTQNNDQNLLYLDLSGPPYDIDFSRYDCVIICAGITNIALCESEPEMCERINSTSTIELINRCLRANAFVIFLSSNAVFDGRKPFYESTDNPNPTNKYGESKLLVETYLQTLPSKTACVLRLTKVITDNTPFVQKWRDAAKDGGEIAAFDNRFFSPVSIKEVVDAIEVLINHKENGIFQLGGSEEISYYDYAKKIFSSEQEMLSKIVATQAPLTDAIMMHNSLSLNLPTKEGQYNELLEAKRISMGLMSGHAYLDDPKRLTFTLSRYKFVSKMFSGLNKVVEIGCADAFGTPIVSAEVNELVACDFDQVFIEDVKKTHPYNKSITFFKHDMLAQPFETVFDGAFALDVLEHIEKTNEDVFMVNIRKSLSANGVCIIGMPSTESQVYASKLSKLGHVNCKKGPELKTFLMRHFERVFVFSMNDEVVHTGYTPMSQYLLALCCNPIKD
ncbi:MAG: sugar nucleotide-binding protein [Paracoccaceae bacterium]|jgi:dTDP-4-dehydrorhamnose reductase/SAM-dependent methyltransferase